MARFSKANPETVLAAMLELEAEGRETLDAVCKKLGASSGTVGPIRNRILDARRAAATIPASAQLFFSQLWSECQTIAGAEAKELSEKLVAAEARIAELEAALAATNAAAEKAAAEAKAGLENAEEKIAEQKRDLETWPERFNALNDDMRAQREELVQVKGDLKHAEGAISVYRAMMPSLDPAVEIEREKSGIETAKAKKSLYLSLRERRLQAEAEAEAVYAKDKPQPKSE